MQTEQLYEVFLRHSSICTDSRNPVQNSLFFALSGPSFNGNAFAEAALNAGCAYAVIDDVSYQKDHRFILVENTLQALQNLSRHHRRQLTTNVIAITGSNGKTTSKELLNAVLSQRFKTISTIGNLNNHIGVPLTLLSIPADAEFAVIEMGASHQGDIRELVEIAEPDYGLITNIGKAHLEGMGGIEGVIKTKTELYDFLRREQKKVFINSMHPVFTEKSKGMDIISFGEHENDHFQGLFIEADPCVKFKWKTRIDDRPWMQISELRTMLIGKYNYENLLAAAAVGSYFGVEESDINSALSNYTPENNRSQVIHTDNFHLIMDAYNANPTSMAAALENFSHLNAHPKIVILGQMNELGESAPEEHQKITELAASLGFDKLIFVGEPYKAFMNHERMAYFKDTDTLLMHIKELVPAGSQVLIKGSRSNRLERLKETILA